MYVSCHYKCECEGKLPILFFFYLKKLLNGHGKKNEDRTLANIWKKKTNKEKPKKNLKKWFDDKARKVGSHNFIFIKNCDNNFVTNQDFYAISDDSSQEK